MLSSPISSLQVIGEYVKRTPTSRCANPTLRLSWCPPLLMMTWCVPQPSFAKAAGSPYLPTATRRNAWVPTSVWGHKNTIQCSLYFHELNIGHQHREKTVLVVFFFNFYRLKKAYCKMGFVLCSPSLCAAHSQFWAPVPPTLAAQLDAGKMSAYWTRSWTWVRTPGASSSIIELRWVRKIKNYLEVLI